MEWVNCLPARRGLGVDKDKTVAGDSGLHRPWDSDSRAAETSCPNSASVKGRVFIIDVFYPAGEGVWRKTSSRNNGTLYGEALSAVRLSSAHCSHLYNTQYKCRCLVKAITPAKSYTMHLNTVSTATTPTATTPTAIINTGLHLFIPWVTLKIPLTSQSDSRSSWLGRSMSRTICRIVVKFGLSSTQMLSSLDHANFSPRGSGTSLRVFASLGHFVRFQFLSTLVAARTSEVMRLLFIFNIQDLCYRDIPVSSWELSYHDYIEHWTRTQSDTRLCKQLYFVPIGTRTK